MAQQQAAPAGGILDRDQLITSRELAAFLGGNITIGTLDQWASKGTGGPEFIKVGRNRRYMPADVKAWLERSRRQPGETNR